MENGTILARVREYCLQEALLTPGAPLHELHLAAAVSGGADSMALLRILLALQPEFGFELSACHVNHGLRGESAHRDEAFVRAECARLGVPLRVFHAEELGPVPEHAGEDWARRLRYACFARLCREGIDAVATAHTAMIRRRPCCCVWPGARGCTAQQASGPDAGLICGLCCPLPGRMPKASAVQPGSAG